MVIYSVIASVVFVIQRHENIFYACYCTPYCCFLLLVPMKCTCCAIHSNVRGLMHTKLSTNINAAQLLPKLSKL